MNPFSRGEFVNIIVRNARTHIEEGRARFTDYEIELKTNHISFAVKHSKVRRRYSDFVWLRDRLAQDLMTSDPPNLPGRKLFGRFNTDFIKQRQRKLQDFLNKVVKNNVFLSHAALHLFLQSKMTIEEIESQIDSKDDEDTCDTILSESAFKEANEVDFLARDRLPSKRDSGIESSGHEGDVRETSSVAPDNGDQEEENFADGNTADSEDNADGENELSDDENNNTDEDQLESEFRKLRLPSLNVPLADEEQQDLESSVEFLLGQTSESEDDVIDEDKEIETVDVTKSPTRKVSTGSSKSPRRLRTRSKRRRRTCIAQFNLSEASKSKDEGQSSSPLPIRKEASVRRCCSFDKFSRSFSMFDMKKRWSFRSSRYSDYDLQNGGTSRSSLCRCSSSRFSESDERPRSRFSGSEERFRSPLKRKISLKEYHIVKKDDPCFHVSLDETAFNSSM